MKKICILFLVFAAAAAFSENDFSGQWFVFLEKDGLVRLRTEYDCIIKKDRTWTFVRRADGVAGLSGTLIFTEKKMYLEVQPQGKKTEKKMRYALPAVSWSSDRFRLMDPVFGFCLVFIPSAKVLQESGNLNGTWRLYQLDPESGGVHHAPFRIQLSGKGQFTVLYQKKSKPDAPEKGTYTFKNGILELHTELPSSDPFWSTPVFFFHNNRLVMNRMDVYVCAEKEQTGKKFIF